MTTQENRFWKKPRCQLVETKEVRVYKCKKLTTFNCFAVQRQSPLDRERKLPTSFLGIWLVKERTAVALEHLVKSFHRPPSRYGTLHGTAFKYFFIFRK
jgi:hypothetical protein